MKVQKIVAFFKHKVYLIIGIKKERVNMKIETKNENGSFNIVLNGRLDSMSAGDLESLLDTSLTDSIQTLFFDMASVDYVSSKGLRVLVSAYKKMNGKVVTIANANDSVKEVLRLSGLMKFFDVK